jgi:hypothetical protein
LHVAPDRTDLRLSASSVQQNPWNQTKLMKFDRKQKLKVILFFNRIVVNGFNYFLELWSSWDWPYR